jgi:hypothetical protein
MRALQAPILLVSALVMPLGSALPGCGEDAESSSSPPPSTSGGAGGSTTSTTSAGGGGSAQGGGGSAQGGGGSAQGGGGSAQGGGGSAQGGGGSGQGGGGGAAGCRPPAPADRERAVLISHPYVSVGVEGADHELLWLSAGGLLSRPGIHFELAHAASMGVIAFTPDGELAFVPQPDDSSIGVVRIDEAGELTVLEPRHTGEYYPETIVMDPSGERFYVIDPNTRDNGGGVYSVRVGCDDTLTDEGRLVPAGMPAALSFFPGDPSRALLAAPDALSSPSDLDAHLLAWGTEPSWLDGDDLFPDNNAWHTAVAIMADGAHALVSDFYPGTNRVGVARIDGDDLGGLASSLPIYDPVDVIASPFGNAALVVSGYGDDVIVLSYHPGDPTEPFVDEGAPAYEGEAPELPGKAALIERGSLAGLVLVSEVSGVRPFLFRSDGSVEDMGRFFLELGYPNMVGAIGVQP